MVNTSVGKSNKAINTQVVIWCKTTQVYSSLVYFKHVNMITIKVNDTQKEFSDTTTLEGLINNLQVKTNGIAIAVNGSVVKKDNWSSQQLQNNDTVLIIKSTQGG
ncbi:protein of unknown function [Tenacibaculum sp. 190524A02b]|uniref:Sulfur carrier protein n=2 Tax=Tenacibaculum vairaonense TaxID=3137860 RepID=A0ABP1FA58_9FLAO